MYPVIHYAISRALLWTACGKDPDPETVSQLTENVTCRSCRRTKVFRRRATAKPRRKRTNAWALLK